MTRRSGRYTVQDLAAALDATPATVRRHLRSLGVHGGSGWRHEWDAGRYRRLLETIGRRIAEGVPASSIAYDSGLAGDGAYRGIAGSACGIRGAQRRRSRRHPRRG